MLSARLSIYSKTSSLNSLGETALTTTLLRKIWAQEMSIKLSEEEESKSVKSLDKYKFKARYNTWLKEEHEIQFDGGVMTQ